MDLEGQHQVERQFFARQALLERNNDMCMDKYLLRYQSPCHLPIYPKDYLFYLLGHLKGKVVLDYGCGNGENSVLLAKCGTIVHALGISPEMCKLAEKRLSTNGLISQVKISCCEGESTGYPDDFFDVICGFAVLHHIDMEMACKEVRRVLKPAGIAIFMEPVALSRFYRWAKRQLRRVIPPPPNVTENERQLGYEDLEMFTRHFKKCTLYIFRILQPFTEIAIPC